MTASWRQMPPFGDPGYDRSEWLVEADPIELMREHREMLHIVTAMITGASPTQVFELLRTPILAAAQHERSRQTRARDRLEEYSDD